jgi:homoserine O-acetyltransferase
MNKAPETATTVTLTEQLVLTSGRALNNVEVSYETYGSYRPDANNAVLIFHALSGDSHVASHNTKDTPGWWEAAVGPGITVDTNEYYVICANVLGGCRGSTGPGSINPVTGKIYGSDFPEISIADMANHQKMLLDHLGIDKVRTVIGSSMGGMLALYWGLNYSETTSGVIVVASAHRLSTQALAFDIVGRNAIQRDPEFHNGDYEANGVIPSTGLAIARMIGHITYLSRDGMTSRFETDRLKPRDIDTEFEKIFSVGSYLGYQGEKFVERFDANSYIALTRAMDHFDLGNDFETLKSQFAGSKLHWLFLTFSSDWLFPPKETEECLKAVSHNNVSASYCSYVTDAGHDAFLLPKVINDFSDLVKTFTRSVGTKSCFCNTDSSSLRLDLSKIYEIIEPGSSVLDIGCGTGELLSALCCKECSPLYGIDSDQSAVASCVSKGIPAICMNINSGLDWFSTQSFDYAVLSLTLQSVQNVTGTLKELLRVAKRAVVSFPNFAYHKLREHYFHEGKAPVSTGILKFNWYNSPNIRFFTIRDFEELCESLNIYVKYSLAFDTESQTVVKSNPNMYADMALFVLEKHDK